MRSTGSGCVACAFHVLCDPEVGNRDAYDVCGATRAFCEESACYSRAAEEFTPVGLDPVARVHLMQDAEAFESLVGALSVVLVLRERGSRGAGPGPHARSIPS